MSRGGARYGAGRPGYRAEAEYLQRVDVRTWSKLGYLNRGQSFTWRWNVGGEPAGAIGVINVSTYALTLQFTLTVNQQESHVAQRIALHATPCHFGGVRHWFECPRCHARVAVLYLRYGGFGCRRCKQVAYASQSEDELGRLWRKQSKLEAKLADDCQRPKGMRLGTYERLLSQKMACEQQRNQAFSVAIQRLAGRL